MPNNYDKEISANTITTESVWNENSQGNGVTGGRINSYFDVSVYQKGINLSHSVNGDGHKGMGVSFMIEHH